MRLLRNVAPLALGVMLIACEDDSTGPSPIENLAASSFDALGQSRMGRGDGVGRIASHAAALALRAGVRPARVTITVDGATEQYLALEVEHAFANDVTASPILTLPIVARAMVAWRGSGPDRVIAITVQSDTGTFTWPIISTLELQPHRPFVFTPAIGLMFERDGPPFHAIDGGARSVRQLIGAECSVPNPQPIVQAVYPVLAPKSCHVTAFFTRFNMRVVEGPVPGAVAVRARVVEMGSHEVPGVRLEYAPIQPPCIAC